MTTLSSLKNSSRSTEKLTKALESTQKKFQKDERLWELTVDKAGNGYAIIRFLDSPHADGDAGVPFVQLWSHGFQGPGGWYIENSRTTLNGDADPVSEYNSELWNSEIEANKKIARAQKRQLNYYSNILVIKDPAHPENEGKVFLFRYGKKIFDKIQERIPKSLPDGTMETHDSTDPDFLKFNPYNFWEGADFKLKARLVEGYRSYDKSEFVAPAALFGGDDTKIENLWKTQYSLNELIAPKNFKTYEELKARLDKVLGHDGKKPVSSTTAETTTVAEPLDIGDTTATVSSDYEELDVFRRLADD